MVCRVVEETNNRRYDDNMSAKYIVVIIGLIVVFFSSLCFAESAEEQRRRLAREYADIPKITARKAYALFQQGKILVIDTQPANRFKTQHCVGAISLPVDMINRVKLKVKKNTPIALY